MKKLTLRIDDDLHERLTTCAASDARTLNAVAEELFLQYVTEAEPRLLAKLKERAKKS